MKNQIIILIFLLFTFLISACGNESEGLKGEEDVITLIYSDADTPSTFKVKFIDEFWIPEIEKQTNYKVKIEANYGGSLLETTEVLEGVENGIADIGSIATEPYTDKLFSSTMFYHFPRSGEKWETISEIYQRAIEEIPTFEKEFEENNQRLLFIGSFLPVVFGATYNFESLDDLKGRDWRAASEAHQKLLQNAGANTVSVPFEDVYSSLQTNLIDGVMTNFSGFDSMKFYEIASNVLVVPQMWYATPNYFTINLDTWNNLSTDIQEGILKASEMAQEKFGEVYEGEVDKLIEEEMEKGVNIMIASDEDIEPFLDEEFLEEQRKLWIDELEKVHGDSNGSEYIRKLESIIEEAQRHE